MVNQMQINSTLGAPLTIHEMILGTPQIKALLLDKRISEIEEFEKTIDEKLEILFRKF